MESIVPGRGGWELVEVSSLKPYRPGHWRDITCNDCGWRWTYKGEFKGIKCSRCGVGSNDPGYMHNYRQTPEYKLWNRLRSKGLAASIRQIRAQQVVSSA